MFHGGSHPILNETRFRELICFRFWLKYICSQQTSCSQLKSYIILAMGFSALYKTASLYQNQSVLAAMLTANAAAYDLKILWHGKIILISNNSLWYLLQVVVIFVKFRPFSIWLRLISVVLDIYIKYPVLHFLSAFEIWWKSTTAVLFV